MNTLFNHRCVRGKVGRASALCLVALAAVLAASGEARAQWTTSGTTTSTTNNVGVGTDNPTGTLEVAGPDGTLILSQPGIPGKVSVQAAVGTDLHLSANARWTNNAWGRNDPSLPSWNIFAAPSAGADYAGIRRAAPSAAGFVWTDIMRITNAGNVGIGTTTPGVLNGVNFTSYVPLHIQRQGGAMANVVVDSSSPASGFVINDSSQPLDNRIWTMTQAAGGGKLTFSTYTDGGGRTDRVVIDRAGNLGVGTLAPASRLHVSGDITVDGNINAKYQDVAEWVPTTQKLEAGTVVILDKRNANHVTASASAYDTRVAGVVSARPGLALGERGENKALVATTGRVKVKVDATRAPIQIGDLIVTSDVAGVAMKSEPVTLGGVSIHRPGTIIGKALEPLEKGTGEILVLLSLQ